jgi:hypothetical protein
MASNPLSLRLTDLYRQRLLVTRQRLEREATVRWPTIDRLDATDWADQLAQVVSRAQTEAARASAGYLSAFASLELRRPVRLQIDSAAYAGVSRDGRPLKDALRSPLIGVRARLKEGATSQEALGYGLQRAIRMVSVDFDEAHITALLEAIDRDDRFDGWQRAVRGTCGACLGAATGPSGGLKWSRHPNCQCVCEPRVRGVPDRFPRLTGAELFASKTKAEQDEALGPEAAEKVRSGAIELSDLVAVSPLATADDFLTQAPVQGE